MAEVQAADLPVSIDPSSAPDDCMWMFDLTDKAHQPGATSPRQRWDKICSDVIKLYFCGKNVRQISLEIGQSAGIVRGIISTAVLRLKAERIKQSISKEIFSDKVPVLNNIAECTLVAISEWINELVRSGRHLQMSPKEASNLTRMLGDINEMHRLATGQSTQNVSVMHSIGDTLKAIEELKKIDPVFEYPDVRTEQ